MHLTSEQERIQKRALEVAGRYKRDEALLIEVLRDVERTKLHRRLNCPSLFAYAVKILGLSEPVANCFIGVARTSARIVELKRAIEEQRLSVPKASRIVSVLTAQNADRLIAFAQNHTARETDFEVARINPKARAPDRAKPISGDLVKLEMSVPKDIYADLKKAQSILSSKNGQNVDYAGALAHVLRDFLDRHDPVKKAVRAMERARTKQREAHSAHSAQTKLKNELLNSVQTELRNEGPDSVQTELKNEALNSAQTESENGSTDRVQTGLKSESPKSVQTESPARSPSKVTKRLPLTAAQKHAVFARDGGRCTYKDGNGERCSADRWLHIHHVLSISRGGGNEPENLTTLCSFHHDLVHQLSFPLDGQVSWLRSRSVAYGARLRARISKSRAASA